MLFIENNKEVSPLGDNLVTFKIFFLVYVHLYSIAHTVFVSCFVFSLLIIIIPMKQFKDVVG